MISDNEPLLNLDSRELLPNRSRKLAHDPLVPTNITRVRFCFALALHLPGTVGTLISRANNPKRDFHIVRLHDDLPRSWRMAKAFKSLPAQL